MYNDQAVPTRIEDRYDGHSFVDPSTLRLGEQTIDSTCAMRTEGKSLGCENCPSVANTKGHGDAEAMMIYLHALEYEGNGWKYRTEVPRWARTSCCPAAVTPLDARNGDGEEK
jgi:hypothetical protein